MPAKYIETAAKKTPAKKAVAKKAVAKKTAARVPQPKSSPLRVKKSWRKVVDPKLVAAVDAMKVKVPDSRVQVISKTEIIIKN